MKIIITGGTGLIGAALVQSLRQEGHSLTSLVREVKSPADDGVTYIKWDTERGVIEKSSQLEAHDAVIHLAGESVAARWTEVRKRRIRDSRVQGTRLLIDTFVRLDQPPRVVLSASAIGYYGTDRGEEALTETSASGDGFLAQVCREWEVEAMRAEAFGARVVLLRTGVVLSPQGGALKKMLPLFRAGLGGKLGRGNQVMSWIALDDEIAAIQFALAHETLRGPVNLTAPHPVTNTEFTKTLGRVLSRPSFLRVPSFALHLAVGEMAATALGSLRVLPAKLEATRYRFKLPELEQTLRQLTVS